MSNVLLSGNYFQQQRMKKLKRNNSIGVSKTNNKFHSQLDKPAVSTKRNLKQKKPHKGALQKQNIFFDDSIEKDKLFQPNYKKKNSHNPTKERSRSVLYDKKGFNRSNMTRTNSSHKTQQFNIVTAKQLHEETGITGIYSIKDAQINHNKVQSTLYYQQTALKDKDNSIQKKQILIEDAEIQCQSFQLQNICPHQDVQKLQSENRQYIRKIQHLQIQVHSLKLEVKDKQIKFNQIRTIETEKINNRIQNLQKNNQVLMEKNSILLSTVSQQKQQILHQQKTQQHLQEKLKYQQKIKHDLAKENQQSKRRINILEQELSLFQQNLNDFQKIKEVYETRLSVLQIQKKRIKNNATELLQLLQRYKQDQQVYEYE